MKRKKLDLLGYRGTFFLAGPLFGSVLADIVKHRLFKGILKVALFQPVFFVYDVAELFNEVIVDLCVYDCQGCVKPVSR
jgi:hypothetical protein